MSRAVKLGIIIVDFGMEVFVEIIFLPVRILMGLKWAVRKLRGVK